MKLREVFPQNSKMTHPTINDKKVTFSNSSLKLWTERKYAIELIPVKSSKSDPVFLVANTPKDIRNHSLKLAKVFPP